MLVEVVGGLDHEIAKSREGTKRENRELRNRQPREARSSFAAFALRAFAALRDFVIQNSPDYSTPLPPRQRGLAAVAAGGRMHLRARCVL